MRKTGLLLALTLMFFLSCVDKEERDLEFTNYTVERTHQNCNPEDGNCTFINLRYPVIVTDNTAAENINRQIDEHIKEVLDYQDEQDISTSEELADRFIENHERALAEFPDSETAWEASVLGEVLLENEDIISLQLDSQLFTGGAHGYSSISYLNFDPETGELYSHEELFTSDFIDYAEEEFKKTQDTSSVESTANPELFFEDDEFQLPQNIGFTPNAVILHYNARETASYTDKTLTLELPREEVEQYLKVTLEPKSTEAL